MPPPPAPAFYAHRFQAACVRRGLDAQCHGDEVMRRNFLQDLVRLLPKRAQAKGLDAILARLATATSSGATSSGATASGATSSGATSSGATSTATAAAATAGAGPGVFVGRDPQHPLRGRIRGVPSSVAVRGSDGRQAWRNPLTGQWNYRYPQQLEDRDGASKFDAAARYGRKRPALLRRVLSSLRRGKADDDDGELQSSLCFLLLDAFAIRPGGGPASRVRGLTTLRAGDIQVRVQGPTRPGPHASVTLKFVGKDHVPYWSQATLPRQAGKQLQRLIAACRGDRKARVFPLSSHRDFNAFLGGLMPGLTAKMVRTYHASCTFQAALASPEAHRILAGPARRVVQFLRTAAVRVAILCNHRSMGRGAECAPAFDPRKLSNDEVARNLVRDTASEFSPAQLSPAQLSPAQLSPAQLRCWAPRTSLGSYIDPRILHAFLAGRSAADDAEADRRRILVAVLGAKVAQRHAWAAGVPAGWRFCSHA